MLHGIKIKKAARMVYHEGFHNLYRGYLPPLCQKTTSLALMFGVYDTFQREILLLDPSLNRHIVNAVSAFGAGTVEAVLTPFERVQTLMQDKAYHGHFRNTLHAFRFLWPFGIAEYYRGLVPILIRNGPSNILFFELRGEVKAHLPMPRSSTWYTEFYGDFVSGACIGAFISTLCYPLNVVKTQMQSVVGEKEYTRFLQAAHYVYEERNRSWRRIFRGFHLNYTRALVSWGVINASYEVLRKFVY
ncbi:unnamed protein product [Darwinula stevensoni]|uniref:Solute carrier family 25 member 51 n=1 Tax=Darwinula stevensoni TaxID=69355 RepID=A0A7R9A1D7_9CRUS|nr:unnamed protein product [Darwinula stevensoni]CAG0886432.1 unnamed protein product [Darwinula stevensoni]